MQGRLGLRDRGGVETTQLITNCKDKGTESAFKMVQRRARPSLSQQHIKWDRDVLQAYIRAEEQRRVTSKTRNDVHTILSLQSPTKEHPYDVIRNNITRSSMSFRSSRPTVVYKLDKRSTRTAVVFVSDPETISVSRTTLGQPLALASPEPIIVIGKGGISTTMQVCQRALRELTPECFVSLSPCPYTWTR